MQQIKKILAVTVLTMLPVLGHAAMFSSKIALQGVVAGPLKDQDVELDKLLDGVVYDIECTIVSDNKSNQDSSALIISAHSMYSSPTIYLNKAGAPMPQPVPSHGQGVISSKQQNILSVEGVMKDARILCIRNLDDTDTITIQNCYATPSK